MIRDINGDLIEGKNLKISEGAYVDSLVNNSAAEEAGIRSGDVIISVGDNPILKSADLLEQIGQHRPGDEVKIAVNRKGKEQYFTVTLANQKGDKKLSTKPEQDILDVLGASFENLDKESADQLGIKGGVVIKELSAGILKNETGVREGFIITGINNEKVTSLDDLRKSLSQEKGGVMLEGIYPNYPGRIYFAFGLPE